MSNPSEIAHKKAELLTQLRKECVAFELSMRLTEHPEAPDQENADVRNERIHFAYSRIAAIVDELRRLDQKHGDGPPSAELHA